MGDLDLRARIGQPDHVHTIPGILRHMGVVALVALLGCSSDKGSKQAPAATDPAPAVGTPAAPPANATGDLEPTETNTEAEPAPSGDPIARLCERDADCGCPIPDCPAFFAKAALPTTVVECFIEQSCESLCAADSGAPGSTLHAACMQGMAQPAAPASGGRTACRVTNQCASNQECCSGYCYQIGTSLWQTHCQMPSGKF
jgi:hypothetical protein